MTHVKTANRQRHAWVSSVVQSESSQCYAFCLPLDWFTDISLIFTSKNKDILFIFSTSIFTLYIYIFESVLKIYDVAWNWNKSNIWNVETENLLWTQQGFSLILPNTTNLALCQTVIPANVMATLARLSESHWITGNQSYCSELDASSIFHFSIVFLHHCFI